MKLSSILTSVVTGVSLAQTATASLVEVWYNISYAEANPDGLFSRKVVGVNGTWPPPPLNVNVGDTVRVHAFNGLDEPTALHHHGIFFNGTSYYDGAPGVTQCGIPVGQSLTYEIPVDDQWGTYWWHSHVGGQNVNGLRAPFLVHPAVEVHSYDEEYTIIVSDWYHEQHKTLLSKFLNIYNPTGAEPVPDSAAIYISQNGTYLPGFNENAAMTFVPGKTYRLRIINAGAFGMFMCWIDGHKMRIIEADGTDVEESPVDYVGLGVAQRYSVLVTALNTTDLNFKFNAIYDASMFDTVPEALQLNYTSSVIYNATAPQGPADIQYSFDRMPDEGLVPSIVEPQLAATRAIELGVFFDTFDDGVNRAAFNNITFIMPKVPSLFSQQSMGLDASNPAIYGPQTHAYVLKKGEIIDLQIVNWDGNSHPFHLHGHKYQIVRVATDVSSDDPLLNPPHTEGAANPMRRDTIVVPGGGAYNVRFVADNPGTWIFHCHIEWHLESGLAMIFIEAPTESQQTIVIPQVMKDQCASLGIATTGNAVGRNSTTDLAGVAVGPSPQILGWRPKAIGALAGTILAALLGMLAVVWYALIGGQLEADELEDEVRRAIDEKKAKGGGLKARAWKGIKGAVSKK